MGSRDAIRHAFKHGLIDDGEQWMEMLKSRNLTSHTYNEQLADKVAIDVLSRFLPLLERLDRRMSDRAAAEQDR